MGRLPTTKTKPKTDLSQMIVLLYGPAKIGKSTWASQAPGAIFLATEAGLGQLSVYSITSENAECCETWEDVVMGITELLNHARDTKPSEDQFSTVVIDTVEELCDLAAQHVINQHNQKAERKAEHISDIPYGKGYAALWRECKGLINRIARSRYGLVLIAHSYEIEKEDTSGSYNVTVPALSGKLRSQVNAMADLILYADTVTEGQVETRVLHTKPSRYFNAGDRTGRLPARLPLSFDAVKDALQDKVRAWAVALYQRASQHPGLPDQASRMQALANVVQAVTGNADATFDLELLRKVDDEIRSKIGDMVENEVSEALQASQAAGQGQEGAKNGVSDKPPTPDTPDDEGASEGQSGPEKPKGKGKGSKKGSGKAEKEPGAQPEEVEGDKDGQAETFEYSQPEGPTPFD